MKKTPFESSFDPVFDAETEEGFAGQIMQLRAEETPVYQILRLARLVRLNLIQSIKQAGLNISPEHFFLLLKLLNEDGLTRADLVDPLLDDHSNITRLLDGLEDRGYVERQKHPSDRRKLIIKLLPEGAEAVKTMAMNAKNGAQMHMEGFSMSDFGALLGMMNKYQDNVVRHTAFLESDSASE